MYNHQVVVHESSTLMGYLSAIVPGVGFATGILILPQRQTALVAKQPAEMTCSAAAGCVWASPLRRLSCARFR